MPVRSNEYSPIADYGVIGNLRTVALICRNGSIDWCCFPHLEHPSVFAAILDVRQGGRFKISVPGARGNQRYRGDTNVLETRLVSDAGRLTITDFMPLSGDIQGIGPSEAPAEIHRILQCEGEQMDVEVEWSPRFDYARAPTRMERIRGGWLAGGRDETMVLCGMDNARIEEEESGPVLLSRFAMRAGETRVLLTRWGTGNVEHSLDESMEKLGRTLEIWMAWAHRESVVRSEKWAGEWLPMVIRSELVLKLLTHADTGAIAAAPTTSLPETIGGVRNWDYRYSWIRDSALTAQALVSMGHRNEALELLSWMEDISAAQDEDRWDLKIMYGLCGGPAPEETRLDHLEGYHGSSPVVVGNGAAKQFQLETYGELLNAGYELVRRGERPGTEIMGFLRQTADHLLDVWDRPDHGIWEMRTGKQHFTYSKVMAWVALDKAVQLSAHLGFPRDVSAWRAAREGIHEQILLRGFDEDLGSFVMAYGSKDLDAANLRIPILEFLPTDDPRVRGTIDRTMERLTENGLVYRYHADDGLPGQEGAFGLCSFWLADALSLSGRIDEAWEAFTAVAGRANHVGLFPEQFDAGTGEFLGNFPQAFTHIGLINSLLYLAYAEGKELPEHAPIGTSMHMSRPWNI